MGWSASIRILWLAVVVLITVGLPPPAYAGTGKCFLRIEGKVYLNSRCNFERDDKYGSFSVGRGQTSRSKYFAMVDIDLSSGEGLAFWNGIDAASHAQEGLGKVVKQGNCWVDADTRGYRVEICAEAK